MIHLVSLRVAGATTNYIIAKPIQINGDHACPPNWVGPDTYEHFKNSATMVIEGDTSTSIYSDGTVLCRFDYGCPFGGEFLNSTGYNVCEAPGDLFSTETAHGFCCGYVPDQCSVSCDDPIRNGQFCGIPWNQEKCSYRGTCTNGICECELGYYGDTCEMRMPCSNEEYTIVEKECEGNCLQESGVKLTLFYPKEDAPAHCTFNMTVEECALTPCHEVELFQDNFITSDSLDTQWLETAENSGKLSDFLKIEEIAETWNNMTTEDEELQKFLGDVIRQRLKEGAYLNESIVNSMVDNALQQALGEIQEYNEDLVDPNCEYGAWETVSGCTIMDCDTNIKVEKRDRTSGSPTLCNDVWKFTSCTADPSCSQTCFFTEWSEWTPCPQPDQCLRIPRFRMRSMWKYNPAVACEPPYDIAPIDAGDEFDHWRIIAESCPLADECDECTTTPWTEWSGCPLATNCTRNITEFRTRNLRNLHVSCENVTLIEYSPCPPVNESCDQCHMGEWGPWTECPNPNLCLEGSIRFRERHLLAAPTNWNTAIECPPTLEKDWCPVADICNEVPVGCGPISEWSPWSKCPSVPCTGHTSIRTGIARQNHTGIICNFEMEEKPCLNLDSGGNIITDCDECLEGTWTNWDQCPLDVGCANVTITRIRVDTDHRGIVCNTITETTVCPMPEYCESCQVGDWEPWSECPAETCQAGTQIRTRPVLWAGDWDCPHLLEARECELPAICTGSASCTLQEDWVKIGTCVGDCQHEGKQRFMKRTRNQHTNEVCNLEMKEEICEPAEWECAEGCKLGEFEWSQCLGGCDMGVRIGVAALEDPRPGCTKPLVKTEPCQLSTVCNPVHQCVMGPWGNWTTCLATPSGDNIRIRSRSILTYGDNCGSPIETEPCSEQFTTEAVNASVSFPECELSDWMDAGDCVNGYLTQTKEMIMPGENCDIPVRQVRCSAIGTMNMVLGGTVVLSVIISILALFIQPMNAQVATPPSPAETTTTTNGTEAGNVNEEQESGDTELLLGSGGSDAQRPLLSNTNLTRINNRRNYRLRVGR